jgi:tripartite-type tricarboxylate transporter receptor subunit TctC
MKSILLAVILTAINLFGSSVAAASYPDRPVTIIVGYPPGGPSDTLARRIADELSTLWKQPVVIKNKAGASGIIGMEDAARSPADGYTLTLVSTTALAINPFIYKNLPYDVDRDFTPVALLARIPNVLLVNPHVPANSLKELIALMKKQPGKLNGGFPGLGNSAYIALAELEKAAHAKVLHVSYKGDAAGLTALMSNEIQVYFTVSFSAAPLMKAGRVKAIAITGPERSKTMPDVPTMAQAGLPEFFDSTAWFGLSTRAGVPGDIVKKINADVNTVLRHKKIQDYLASVGALPGSGSVQEFTEFVNAERKRWGAAVKETGAKVE